MKFSLSLFAMLIVVHYSFAQTNTFPDNGNVGIGTISPQEKLEVTGNQKLYGDLLFGSHQTAYYIHALGNGGAIRLRSNITAAEDRNVQFGNIDNNGVWKSYMIVDQTGNVGIGTISPASTLQVNGPTVLGTVPTLGSTLNSSMFISNGTGLYGLLTGIDGVTGNTWLQAQRTDGTATAYNILLNPSGGNVGIGTTNPLSALDVSGNFILRNYQNIAGAGASVMFTPYGADFQHAASIRSYLDNAAGLASQIRLILSSYGNGKNNDELTLMNGNVGIGTITPDQKLTVNGTLHAREIKVDVNIPGPDYVFEKNYKLRSLTEVNDYITLNKHLPEIPSAKNMKQNGIDVTEMNIKLLQKIEELTLYLIEKDKQLKAYQMRLKKVEDRLDAKN